MADDNDISIWRCTTGVVSEASVAATDLLSFNDIPVTTTGGYVHMTEIRYRNSVPENERISGNINAVQDMGLDGIDYQLTTTFKNCSNTSSTHTLAILKTWMNEVKINTTFPEGRFAIRMDNNPNFNVKPSSTYGLVIAGISIIGDPARGEEVQQAIINLRFGGDPTGLGT